MKQLLKHPFHLAGSIFLLSGILLLGGCKPTPVLDLTGPNLDVKISVLDFEPSPDDGKVPVIVQFFSEGKFIQLAPGATVTCNGITMPWAGLWYAERIPLVAAGGTYTVRHTRAGIATNVSVNVPARPVITSPAAGATVTRTSNLTINYVAGSGSATVKGSAGQGQDKSASGNAQPDDGSYEGLNVSSFGVGAGTVSISRERKTNPPSGFKSVEVTYSVGNRRNVIWN